MNVLKFARLTNTEATAIASTPALWAQVPGGTFAIITTDLGVFQTLAIKPQGDSAGWVAIPTSAGHGPDVEIQAILGSHGLVVATFHDVASAVNNLDIASAATGNAPSIEAVGTDTNIDMKLLQKGSGTLRLGTGASGAKLAAFGASGATQQAAPAVPTDLPTALTAITAIRTALINYGLLV